MKSTIAVLLLSLATVSGFAQDLYFSVHGNYKHAITKEKLSTARSMSDIIPYYPASWITSYTSAEISATGNGTTITSSSSNDIFSEEQIEMLGSLDFGTEIVIKIGYMHENSLTNKVEDGMMNYSATVVPDTEAQYPDGFDQLSLYIKQNTIDKISPEDSKEMQDASVIFTINEDGGIADVRISDTSGNREVDNLFLEVIHDMPKWKPATDSQGKNVKQEFVLTISTNEGC